MKFRVIDKDSFGGGDIIFQSYFSTNFPESDPSIMLNKPVATISIDEYEVFINYKANNSVKINCRLNINLYRDFETNSFSFGY